MAAAGTAGAGKVGGPVGGALERDVMARLWDSTEPLTVRQVHEQLRTDGDDLAYTTVMTVLDRLAKKGVVRQERDGRAYHYSPVQTREELTAGLMLEALGSAPDPSARDAALVHFVGRVGPQGVAALRAALDAAG
ncbi:BlaI/MecI/CopY family transcriptional regulator [Quadrisphaera granulorum]|uniref:BlaI/MecI/CopY family transcriptional regulator n=1 Tax=Quadrisphaera granulorum TaxID=317664 RepID=UPI0024821CE7|nr:BlaI/MecI/CopY family transcriptional regulator [Quadrisphaera granulorum]